MKLDRERFTALGILLFALAMLIIEPFVSCEGRRTADTRFRETMLAIAAQQKGKPYREGGNGPDSFDCSGLVVYCIRRAAEEQGVKSLFTDAKSSELARDYSSAVDSPGPGDLAFFQDDKGSIIHTAIIAEDRGESLLLIEASRYEGEVCEREVSWSRLDLHSVCRPLVLR